MQTSSVPSPHRFKQGILKLWLDISVGYVAMVAMLAVYMWRLDWPLQAQLAVVRAAVPAVADGDAHEKPHQNKEGGQASLLDSDE